MTISKNQILSSLAALSLAGCIMGEEQKPTPPPAPPPAQKLIPVQPVPPPPPPPPPPATPDAEFRATKPAPAASAAQFTAPVPAASKLKNGAQLLVVENHAVPLVSIDLLIETGTDGEPAGKAGLASFVARMLDEGTKTHSATEQAEKIEDLAAHINAFAGQETTRVHLNCLKETLPEALALFGDMVMNPAFKKDDVERVRAQLISELAQKMASPPALARDEMSRILYGDKHPWGQPAGGTEATLKSITVADLAKFHEQYFRPTNAILSVSGDVSAAEISKLLGDTFAAWKKKPRIAIKLPKFPAPAKRSVVLVDKPGASQSQVWTFGRSVAAKDPDAIPLRIASYILGGPFARLDMNIRENKGYSYGVRSTVGMMREHGTWLAAGGIKANVTAEALTEFEKELAAFSTGQLKEGELANAKEALVRSLPSTLETNDAVAGAMAQLAFNGQPLDYYRTLPANVAKVDAAEVARVAAKYDRPADWSIVIVGPRAASEEKLAAMKLGDITVKSTTAAAVESAKGPTAKVETQAVAKPAAATDAKTAAASDAKAAKKDPAAAKSESPASTK